MEKRDGMDEFERELAGRMQRVEAPAGFADRVMRKTLPSPALPLRWPARLAAQRWAAGALAACVLVGAGFGVEVERRRQQRRAEREFALAMQVTSHALEQSRQQLSRAGFRLVD